MHKNSEILSKLFAAHDGNVTGEFSTKNGFFFGDFKLVLLQLLKTEVD